MVVYCSVDEVFARGILDEFAENSGIIISPVFDSEAGKTTGLVQRIIQEARTGRPRADVFWSSEVFETIRLAELNLLESYASPQALDIPERFKDPGHRWTANAVRGRVLAYDPRTASEADLPTRWEQLAEGRFASRLAFANPLFGTTRGHVAAMFTMWGPDRSRSFLTGLRDGGALMVDGNSSAVRAVLAGRASLAATDTDDVWLARRQGANLNLRYLDMGGGGTLLIPCTVALLKNAPNPVAAQRVVDYLVASDVERRLAQSDSRNVPVRTAIREELGLSWPPESEIPFGDVAGSIESAMTAVREILIR